MTDPTRASRATSLLERLHGGDDRAGDELLPLVYTELHDMAQKLMRGERRDHTLQPTALVHEAWLRLGPNTPETAERRPQFMAVAARAMRNVLVDHARQRQADKRRGDRAPVDVTLVATDEDDDIDVLALHEALERLDSQDPQLGRIVELRFFGGLTLEETATSLEITMATVRWSWDLARAWLHRELGKGETAGG